MSSTRTAVTRVAVASTASALLTLTVVGTAQAQSYEFHEKYDCGGVREAVFHVVIRDPGQPGTHDIGIGEHGGKFEYISREGPVNETFVAPGNGTGYAYINIHNAIWPDGPAYVDQGATSIRCQA